MLQRVGSYYGIPSLVILIVWPASADLDVWMKIGAAIVRKMKRGGRRRNFMAGANVDTRPPWFFLCSDSTSNWFAILLRYNATSHKTTIAITSRTTSTTTSINMKFTILKLTAFAMLATASASGVYASSDSESGEPSSQSSLRGSFLSEEEKYQQYPWWNHVPQHAGSPYYGPPRGGGDLSTCKTNCQCPEGKAFLWNFSQFYSPAASTFLLSNAFTFLIGTLFSLPILQHRRLWHASMQR